MPYKDQETRRVYQLSWAKSNRDRKNRYNRNWVAKNVQRLKKYRREYLTKTRDKRRRYMFDWRNKNRLAFREFQKKHGRAIRIKALSCYDSQCSCCGEKGNEFLTFDHVNGNGKNHRKKVGRSQQFYYWLIRNKRKRYIRILCYNCHFASRYRGNDGICPHKA